MRTIVTDSVQTPFSAASTSQELLGNPVDALLGVTADARQALVDLGIETVFDLATSSTFHAALAVLRAANGDSAALRRSGILPGELVDATVRSETPIGSWGRP